MTKPRRRLLPAALAALPILAVAFVASPWPVDRLVERELLPAGAIRP